MRYTGKQAEDLGKKMDELLEMDEWILLVHDKAAGETAVLSNIPSKVIPRILFSNATKLRRKIHSEKDNG